MGEGFIVRRGTPPEFQLIIEEGLIVQFFGLSSAIPEGWLLCDGNNSTPDLREKFIVGAGDTYAINSTGGSANSIVIDHTHTATTNTTGNHTHNFGQGGGSGSGGIGFANSNRNHTVQSSSNGDHTHTLTIDTTGVSGTGANLPPYYSLVYMIKGAN
jgi:hypothetical protein